MYLLDCTTWYEDCKGNTKLQLDSANLYMYIVQYFVHGDYTLQSTIKDLNSIEQLKLNEAVDVF